ncbi:DUF86 domain-containing protein [Methanospirillum purgamenti]|uniref:DUF86 domain-containing protein n=1 Tax=Methanospirillum hungatei TaxID=2203 RepID=A0A8F5ZHB2_METHU|nr:DUF86 domain-containing protein [Methanospirillum hungatei]QXO95669.1 DUF86 domain-containing protein [Methanospirillum hungatei]
MPREQLLYLSDIMQAINNIQKYVGDNSFEDFSNDQMRIDAVIRNFEIIGEATKSISTHIKEQFPKTDWKSIAGFRDILIHGYFGIDTEILWDVIENKLPELKEEINQIINSKNY